jgi:uncharacterized protein
VLLLIVSCESTNRKHEDGATMTPEPVAAPGPSVSISTPTGDTVVQVEVVSTPAKIERGLMYREHLGLEAGMLFIMGHEEDWAFYMRNTLIPLDMIFITREMTVAGISANATPRTETLRRVGMPSLYVLEVNGGWAAAHQVFAGAHVRFDRVDK